MFEYTITARFDDIDYAGRVFYGRYFNYVHVAEEEWFTEMGYSIPDLNEELGVLFPIVHTEGDFLSPIELGDEITVTVGATTIGTSSIDVRAVGYNETTATDAFEIEVTRVCMSSDEESTRSIPDSFRTALESYRWDSA